MSRRQWYDKYARGEDTSPSKDRGQEEYPVKCTGWMQGVHKVNCNCVSCPKNKMSQLERIQKEIEDERKRTSYKVKIDCSGETKSSKSKTNVKTNAKSIFTDKLTSLGGDGSSKSTKGKYYDDDPYSNKKSKR